MPKTLHIVVIVHLQTQHIVNDDTSKIPKKIASVSTSWLLLKNTDEFRSEALANSLHCFWGRGLLAACKYNRLVITAVPAM